MTNMEFKMENIKEIMLLKGKKKRETKMVEMLEDYKDITKSFKSGGSKWYCSCPLYLIIDLSNDRVKQNTQLLAMYICSTKRLLLDVNKINEMFGVKVKNVKTALGKIVDIEYIKGLGFDVEVKELKGIVYGFLIKANFNNMMKLEKDYEIENDIFKQETWNKLEANIEKKKNKKPYNTRDCINVNNSMKNMSNNNKDIFKSIVVNGIEKTVYNNDEEFEELFG